MNTVPDRNDGDAFDVPNDKRSYHDLPGISNSMLKVYDDAPEEYYDRFVAGKLPRFTPATADMQRGLDLENILWGHDPRNDVVVIPSDCGFKTRRGKAWDAFAAKHTGKRVMWPKEYDECFNGIDAALKRMYDHTEASLRMLTDVEPWQVWQWQCPVTGLDRRCETDMVAEGWITDLKSSQVVEPQALARHVYNMRWHWQLATAREAIRVTTGDVYPVCLVISQSRYPWRCVVVDLTDWMDFATNDMHGAMVDLHEAILKNDWRARTDDKLITIDPPKWR